MTDLVLLSPLRGWVAPLEEVDDPVFAGRMLGDGVAIDPTGGEVRAPCAGVVVSLHSAGHAVSLRADNGAEILIHVGLETVSLGGEGFRRHVADGQHVAAGDLLISVDLDLVAAKAKSLITPVVITNGEAFAIVSRNENARAEIGDEIMTIRGQARPKDTDHGRDATASRPITVPLAHGLHARPSALVAAEAKRHHAEITLSAAGRSANAKSPVAIMALGLGSQEQALIMATGPDAEAAVTALADLIERRLPPEPAPAVPAIAPRPSPPQSPPADGLLMGTSAAPGLAIGSAARLIPAEPTVIEQSRGAEAEILALGQALETVRARLTAQAASGPREQREIVQAHLAFLDDQELMAAAHATISGGASAGIAWRRAMNTQIETLRGIADAHIAQRADDLIELERAVLMALSGEGESRQLLPDNAIVLADELGAGQLMSLEGHLAAICLAGGGPTSHVAILAAAMNIPAVVAIGQSLAGVPDGATLIVDGATGEVRIAPHAAELEAAQTRLAAIQAHRHDSRLRAAEPCRMADGTRIEVFANLGSQADAAAAVANGAEGCGLLRTEFLFLERVQAPDEDEQAQCYQAIATALEGRPLVVRTLDVGGDKPAPFLDLPVEENPALGLRGIRVSLWRPEILRAQLRAILRVRPHGQCRILVPMVASLSELTQVRAMVEAARVEMAYEGPVQIGVMIETPAAAVTADLLAVEADFLSIGTNDLTQYVLAMDRGNPQMAASVDALHPAVLRMIAQTTSGARVHGRPVAVCGGLAADAAAAAILIGLGVSELSAPPAVAPEIKAAVRALTMVTCEALAARALACSGPGEVRALLANAGRGDEG
ncbi:MAG TPA: phosphoenolpyruvate--protein phosphotransferase [Caulobacteraceae bacterium]